MRTKVEFKHVPVLLNECIEGLNIKKDGIYVDGTIRWCMSQSKNTRKIIS